VREEGILANVWASVRRGYVVALLYAGRDDKRNIVG